MPISKKAAFIRHLDPDAFVAKEQKKRPWMPHRVALLIMASRGDAFVAVTPKPKSELAVVFDHVRVPPQMAFRGSILSTASALVDQCLVQPPADKYLQYLGTARGNIYRGEDQPEPYGKYIHWVGVRIVGGAEKRSLRHYSLLFSRSYWCSAGELLALPEALAMSERKYLMTLQAIAAFALEVRGGPLVKRAREQLCV